MHPNSLIGFGCMLAWLSTTKYLDTTKGYSIFGRTLSLSLPNVYRTMVSSLPFLMGYAFLGAAIFWRSNRFSTPSGALVTWFALMNGDMVYDSFADIRNIDIILS